MYALFLHLDIPLLDLPIFSLNAQLLIPTSVTYISLSLDSGCYMLFWSSGSGLGLGLGLGVWDLGLGGLGFSEWVTAPTL